MPTGDGCGHCSGTCDGGHFLLFDCLLTVVDDSYTVPIVKNTQNHWCTNRQRSTKTVPTVYQRCTNRQKQSKTANQQKITIDVPIVTCLHRVRRIHKVQVSRIHKSICAWSSCHLANGNKTCPNLLVFKNNNMVRGSQGFVCQSSRNAGT